MRFLDIIISVFLLIVLLPLIIGLTLLVFLDIGSPFFIQERVGKNKQKFYLYKFRTMLPGTASVATHLADASAITKLGKIMRKLKLDELPQLINVIKGEMSLVGPRPCLPSQKELITVRAHHGVFSVSAGITGLAQLKGIDMSTPELLAKTDAEMIKNLTISTYLSYIAKTALGGGRGDRVIPEANTKNK